MTALKTFFTCISPLFYDYILLREALFIFWTLATLSVLRCHLTFSLVSLAFLTITTFRMFCHLSVICVVYSDLEIVSKPKNWINSWKFSCDDLLRLLTWIIKTRNLFSLLAMKLHPMPLWNDGITSLIVTAIRSPTNFVKIVQNQLLDQKTLMLCKNW